MIKKINKTDLRGQTALIMILLTSVALIFLAITLNWGRIAQTRAMVTMAADQAAALLASDVASYGEMEKQSSLQNANQISSLSGTVMALIGVVVAIICLIITITTAGGGSEVWAVLCVILAVASVIMAIVNLVLEITQIEPGITSMWNKLQKNQPISQQFYEGAIGQALQGVVTDQVSIPDYFDLNTNGLYGINKTNGFPNDTIPRFAFFYTDRLRMLGSTYATGGAAESSTWVNPPAIPNQATANNPSPVDFFLNQLGEFVNGQTCGQNALDSANNLSIPLNHSCPSSSNATGTWISDCLACATTDATSGLTTYAQGRSSCSGTWVIYAPTSSSSPPADPACSMTVPNTIQLSDTCLPDSNPASPSYTPYCDPCCQPPIVKDPSYKASSPSKAHPTPYKLLRPASCNGGVSLPDDCNPAKAGLNSVTANPNDSAAGCLPANTNECVTNNPYGSNYPYIYDSTYQNDYANGGSFLEQFGRDQQQPPFSTTLSPQGNPANGNIFPSGVYPFFWLMKDYSPEVDNVAPSSAVSSAHWCVAGSVGGGGSVPSVTAPTGFPDLKQLQPLGYPCSGASCCVGNLITSATSSPSTPITSTDVSITVNSASSGSASFSFQSWNVNGTTTGNLQVQSGESVSLSVQITETGGSGILTNVSFALSPPVRNGTISLTPSLSTTTTSGTSVTYTATANWTVPSSFIVGDAYTLYGYAQDLTSGTSSGNIKSNPVITITMPGTDTVTDTSIGTGTYVTTVGTQTEIATETKVIVGAETATDTATSIITDVTAIRTAIGTGTATVTETGT